jgi:hypothetical protein
MLIITFNITTRSRPKLTHSFERLLVASALPYRVVPCGVVWLRDLDTILHPTPSPCMGHGIITPRDLGLLGVCRCEYSISPTDR